MLCMHEMDQLITAHISGWSPVGVENTENHPIPVPGKSIIASLIKIEAKTPTCEQVTRCWVRVDESKHASTFSTPALSSM